jgi:hypothetical protein
VASLLTTRRRSDGKLVGDATRAVGAKLVGAIVSKWSLLLPHDATGESAIWIADVAARQIHFAVGVKGFILYHVEFVELQEAIVIYDHHARVPHALFQLASGSLLTDGRALDAWMADKSRLAQSVLQLIPPLVDAFFDKGWDHLYGLAITGRTTRPPFLSSMPSAKVLRRWWLSLGGEQSVTLWRPQPHLHMPVITHPKAHSADVVFEWLEASRHLPDLANLAEAAKCFAVVLARNQPSLSAGQLVAVTEFVSAETLRKARVRCDVVGMHIFRKLWAICNQLGKCVPLRRRFPSVEGDRTFCWYCRRHRCEWVLQAAFAPANNVGSVNVLSTWEDDGTAMARVFECWTPPDGRIQLL